MDFKPGDLTPVDCPCVHCVHWHFRELDCDAFPKGIPAEIWTGNVNHTSPVAGDHGIQYEEIEK
jgi:hypothetical protein